MKEILKIINSEPFGKYTFKVKQITDLVVGYGLHPKDYESDTIKWHETYKRIDETWERLAEGEMVKVSVCNKCKTVYYNVKTDSCCSGYTRYKDKGWQPVKLTESMLHAGDEPPFDIKGIKEKTKTGYLYKPHPSIEQYKKRKELVIFDGWEKEASNAYYKDYWGEYNRVFWDVKEKGKIHFMRGKEILKTLLNPTPNDLHQIGVPYNNNFAELLVK